MKNYLVYGFILLLGFSLKMSAAPATGPSAMQVEILIFSGRPNPVFTLTDPTEIKEITALVSALPKAPAARATAGTTDSVLGYRGIAVENRSMIAPELGSLLVNRSQVQLTRKAAPSAQTASATPVDASEVRLDGGAALENRLLTLARKHGAIDDALLSHITSGK